MMFAEFLRHEKKSEDEIENIIKSLRVKKKDLTVCTKQILQIMRQS